MNSRLWRTGWMVLLAVAGCQKEAKPPEPAALPPLPMSRAVQLVPETEQSRHFAAVNRQLDLGGTLYGYVDIDGDSMKFATSLRKLTDQIVAKQPKLGMYLDHDYAALFNELGFNDVKAIGFSSVAQAAGGFRNRTFFYTPDGRHGLLAAVGGPPAAFLNTNLAPEEADFYSECEVDLPVAYAAVRSAIAKMGGESVADLFENQLRITGAQTGLSALELIQGMKGRITSVICLDPKRNITLPGSVPAKIPAFSMFFDFDGIGQAIEGALARSPLFASSMEGAVHYYTLIIPLPVEGLQPVLAVEGSTLYFATTKPFLDECLHRQTGLDKNPKFQSALAVAGSEGNSLVYINPHFFTRLRELGEMNPQLPPETKQVLDSIIHDLPSPTGPLISVRINQPDGILIRSYWDRSLKQDVALAAYSPLIAGLIPAMAIPAFQKVRTVSHEKSVMNNLRQLSAAAEQFYVEKGVDSATYDDLVGPGRYVDQIIPVAGEDYRSILFKRGRPLHVRTRDGRVFEYQP